MGGSGGTPAASDSIEWNSILETEQHADDDLDEIDDYGWVHVR